MIYVVLLLITALALLQASMIPAVPFLGVRPDLVLLLVLAWTMVRGTREGATAAFVGGLALDALSAFPLGSHALVLVLTILPFGFLAEPRYRGNLLYPIVGMLLATLLYHLLLLGLAQILGQRPVWGVTLWRIVLPLALIEATLMPLVYWVLDSLDRRLRRRVRIA